MKLEIKKVFDLFPLEVVKKSKTHKALFNIEVKKIKNAKVSARIKNHTFYDESNLTQSSPSSLDFFIFTLTSCLELIYQSCARSLNIQLDDVFIEIEPLAKNIDYLNSKIKSISSVSLKGKIIIKSKASLMQLKKLEQLVQHHCQFLQQLTHPKHLTMEVTDKPLSRPK